MFCIGVNYCQTTLELPAYVVADDLTSTNISAPTLPEAGWIFQTFSVRSRLFDKYNVISGDH